MYTIKNEYLTVTIHEKGAILWSITDGEGTEYLWQGKPEYWTGRAPNLFPYIGRLTEGKYRWRGNAYEMGNHGFAKLMNFEAEQISEGAVLFWLEDTEATYEQYPFRFRFGVEYVLEGSRISVSYVVQNKDDKRMYFAVGGHPGFNVPFEAGTVFEDYYLEFSKAGEPRRIIFSEDCFVTEKEEAFPLEEGLRIRLKHELFDRDAIVLKDMADTVSLKSTKGSRVISLSYPDMPYLGFWHKPKTDAPYICIEPWSSLPSRKGVIEDLATQDNLLSLEAGGEYRTGFSISICNA